VADNCNVKGGLVHLFLSSVKSDWRQQGTAWAGPGCLPTAAQRDCEQSSHLPGVQSATSIGTDSDFDDTNY